MSKESAMAMIAGEPTTSVETPAATPGLAAVPAPDAPKEMDSDFFAKKARWESERVKKEQEWKKEKESILAEREKANGILKRAEEFENAKKQDPIAALKLIGFSETDIFNFMAAQEKKEPTQEEKAAQAAKEAAAAEIKAFQDAQAEAVKKEQEAKDTAVITSFKEDISKTIEANKDKFKFCAHYGPAAETLAYDFVLAVVQESKGADVPTYQEAIEMAEDYYRDQYTAMKALESPTPTPTEKEPIVAAPTRTRTVTTPAGHTPIKEPITKTRTLTNNATVTSASSAKKVNETPSQKRERLMEALRKGVKL